MLRCLLDIQMERLIRQLEFIVFQSRDMKLGVIGICVNHGKTMSFD